MPRKREVVFLNLLLLVVTCTLSKVDDTLEPGAHGPKVVEAVIDKLDQVFEDDREFLRRTAVMFSQKRTTCTGSKDCKGNIWQISENLLELTKNSSFPELNKLHKIALTSFSIHWLDPANFTAADLDKPLYSGLAARFLLALEDPKAYRHYEPFERQEKLWKKYYDITLSPAELAQLQKDCKVKSCSHRMNMCIMLDRSGSIEIADYNTSLQFVYELIDQTKSGQVHTAFLVFSDSVTLVSPFTATPEELQKAIMDPSKTLYPKGKTCTSSAILQCVDAFRSSHMLAHDAPNINLLVTDGESSGKACPVELDKALDLVQLANITSFAVGVGPAQKPDELERIADNKLERVFSVTGADDLQDNLARIIQRTCKAPVPLDFDRIVNSVLQKEETQFAQLELPEGDKMEFAVAVTVTKGATEGYYSCNNRNPSSVVHDGKIIEGYAQIQCPPSRERRSAMSSQKKKDRKKVFISITGLAERNVYTLRAIAVPHVFFNSAWFAKSPHISFRIYGYDSADVSGCNYVSRHWITALVLFVMGVRTLLGI